MNGSVIETLTRITRSVMLLTSISLLSVANLAGQSTAAPVSYVNEATGAVTPGHSFGIDVLTDTQGINFDAYIRQASQAIRKTWIPLLPQEAQSSGKLQGETIVRFTINRDGKIAAMHLDERSHEVSLDRAAWGAVTSVGQFQPLPTEFKGSNLVLRIHFLVNDTAVNP